MDKKGYSNMLLLQNRMWEQQELTQIQGASRENQR